MAAARRRPAGWLRQRIIAILATSPQPLPANLLAEACADGEATVQYGSVLRVLGQLPTEGAIGRIEVQRAYLPAERHGKLSLACSRCGTVLALDHDATVELAAVASTLGFAPSRYIVEVAGVCAACRQ